MKVFKSLTMVAAMAVIVMTLQGNSCFNTDDVTGPGSNGGSNNGSNKYDGTYTLVLNGCTWANNLQTCNGDSVIYQGKTFTVLNGNITMLPPPYVAKGSVTDMTFGNVRMTGPCPLVNDAANGGVSVATYTGILTSLSAGHTSGQGQYTCSGQINTGIVGLTKTYLWHLVPQL
jgi:hypothetical protein